MNVFAAEYFQMLLEPIYDAHALYCVNSLQTITFVFIIILAAISYSFGQGILDYTYETDSSSPSISMSKAYATSEDLIKPEVDLDSKPRQDVQLKQEKLSVLDFAAIPNDDKDDSLALRYAIKMASNLSGAVFIPSGTYVVDKSLNIPSNTTIEGEGRENTILLRNILSSNKTAFGKHVFTMKGEPGKFASNVTIANLTVLGSGVNTMGDCIHLRWVKNYTIANTTLYGCGSGSDGAAIYSRETSSGKIINNLIESSRNGYLSAQHKGGSVNVLIANNTISNSIDDAIHPQNGSFNKIIGNTVINSGDDNIDLFYEYSTLIENNRVMMNDNSTNIMGIEVGDGSRNIMIKNNIVNGGVANGINVGSDAIRFTPTQVSNNITILNNSIYNTFENCMRVSHTYDIKIVNNNFEKCNKVNKGPSHGIILTNSVRNISIANNSITYYGRPLGIGIVIDNAHGIDIVSNTIVAHPIGGLYGTGIFIGTLSDNIIIENNDMKGCGCLIKNYSVHQNIVIKDNYSQILRR